LAAGLDVPAEDFIESATAILAKRGSGKSGAIKVIMEEMLEKKLPFAMLDPVGIAWGILSSFDGKKPSGYEVLIVGGEHGHIPLQKDGGATIARAIASENVSVIIDFKGSSKNAYRRFVTDFLNTLRPNNKLSRLIIIGEASRLIPQRIRPDQTECYDAVEETVLLGRNDALGVLLEGQRPAILNKDVLSQMDTVFALNITHPLDKKALQDWFQEAVEADKGEFEKFWAEIQRLQRQEAVIWSPSFLKMFQRFRFRDFTTFHPDRTHLRRQGLLQTTAATTDVSALAERLKGELATVVEKAKADDPAALRVQVRQLKASLDHANELNERNVAEGYEIQEQYRSKPDKVVEKRVEVPMLKDAQIKRLEALAARVEKLSEKWSDVGTELGDAAKAYTQEAAQLRAALKQPVPLLPSASVAAAKLAPVRRLPGNMSIPTFRLPPVREAVANVQSDGDAQDAAPLPKGERIVLSAIAQYPEGVERDQLSVLTGYKRSSRDAYLSRLREKGMIDDKGTAITATDVGVAALGSDYEPLPTGAALQEHWRRRLPEGERRVFEVVLKAGGKPVSREAIDAQTNYKRSSRDAYIARLKARRIIEVTRDGIAASQSLFIEVPA
jgi:hypothetical protein